MTRPSFATSFLLAAASLTLGHANAFADGPYLPPENPARREMVEDNTFTGGQPSDLVFQVESVKFLGPPCRTHEKDILQKAEIVIEVGWKKSHGAMGVLCIQAEGSDTTNGNDQLVFEINGRGRWTVASVTRDGANVMGGASPEGQNGGNGTWDGVRITPPSSFETGRYQSGNDPKQTMRYTITLDYHPLPGDLCRTVGFLLRGYYLHTYDGTFEFSCDNALEVSASFPWGVSLGGTVSWANDHAWQKQLVNPTSPTGEHTASYEPGGNWVPGPDCCPTPAPTPTPEPGIDETDTDPDADDDGLPGDFEQDVHFEFTNGTDLEFATVEVIARTPQGIEVASAGTEISLPCQRGCQATVAFAVPTDYPFDSILIDTIVYGNEGGVAATRDIVQVALGANVPTLSSSSGLPEGRLLVPDNLLVHLSDPTRPLPVLAQFTQLRVFDQFGQLRDQEQGQFSGNPQWQVQMQVISAAQGPVLPMNGKLSVLTGDTVVVSYMSQNGVLIETVEVHDRPGAIVDGAASQPSFSAIRLEGVATGVPTLIEATFDDGTAVLLPVILPAGSSAGIATATMEAMLAATGIDLAIGPNGAAWVVNSDGLVRLRFSSVDPGFDLLGASGPTPDLNGDGDVDASDLAVLLGAWGTPTADLNGDGTTDAADLAILLGAW